MEERKYLLNLFIKQLVRCPYLLESEEFYLYVRPHNDLEKALTLLPKLSMDEQLQRISRYYTFMGEITESKIQKQTNHMFNFVKEIRHAYAQLDKFRESIVKMEAI